MAQMKQTQRRKSALATDAVPPVPTAPKVRPALREAGDEDRPVDEFVVNGVHYERQDFFEISAEAIEVEQSRLTQVNLGASTLEQAVFSDVVFEGCDLVNMSAPDMSLLRSSVTSCRILGVAWPGANLRDVSLTDCRGQLASLRAARLRTVTFVDCDLRQVDFAQAELIGVRFTGCDLTGAQFSHAKLANVRFENCDLAGIGGALNLKGATIVGGDLLGLGAALARDAGITIEM